MFGGIFKGISKKFKWSIAHLECPIASKNVKGIHGSQSVFQGSFKGVSR